MFFSSSKKEPSAEPQKKSRTSSTLRFMFAPEFGNDVRPVKQAVSMFVNLVAALFAMHRLFPANHPALIGVPGPQLTLKEVIITAYRSLRFTPEGVPQIILFAALVGSLAIGFLAVATFILYLAVGAAHASDAISCTNTGIFSPCTDSDLSIQWLDYIFGLKSITSTGYNGTVGGNVMVQTALLKAFKFYSNAILVMAGIIMMYHLVSMVAETAHTGKAMGRANQIWAPIRLVVAICLLVPASSSGINVGQSIMVQVAKWGCGLASQTWVIFLNSLTSDSTTLFIAPKVAPSVQKAVENMLLAKACVVMYNNLMNASGLKTNTDGTVCDASKETVSTSNFSCLPTNYTMSQQYGQGSNSTNIFFTSTADGGICGSVFYPQLSSTATLSVAFEKNIYSSYKTAFNSSILNNSTLTNYANMIVYYKTPILADGSNRMTNAEYFVLANSASSGFASALSSASSDVSSTSVSNFVSQWSGYGWLAAGAWFNTIARVQSMIMDASQNAVPTVNPPDMARIYTLGNLGNRGHGAAETAERQQTVPEYKDLLAYLEEFSSDIHNSIKSNNIMTESGGANTTISDELGKANDDSDSLSYIFRFINTMGVSTGAWPNSTYNSLIFQMDSGNPLTELIQQGYGFLRLGLGLIVAGFGTEIGGNLFSGIPVIGGVGKAVATFGSLLLTVGGLFFTMGAVLTFLVPMIPFARFFFASLTWAIMVFEAVVSMPLFALAHISPYGEGLPGQQAQQGYFFMLAILLRPVLMIIGLMAGLVLFNIAVIFLNKMFVIAASGSGSFQGFATLSKLFYSIYYMLLVYICANTCFKAIGHFPDHAMSWMGTRGPGTKDLGDPATLSQYATIGLGYLGMKGLSPIGQGLSSLGKAGGEKMGGALKGNAKGNISQDIMNKNKGTVDQLTSQYKNGEISDSTMASELTALGTNAAAGSEYQGKMKRHGITADEVGSSFKNKVMKQIGTDRGGLAGGATGGAGSSSAGGTNASGKASSAEAKQAAQQSQNAAGQAGSFAQAAGGHANSAKNERYDHNVSPGVDRAIKDAVYNKMTGKDK